MKDFKCICGKSYKTERNYNKHIDSCEVFKASQVCNDIDDSEISPSGLGMELDRRINKLRDKIKGVLDAEVKHRLECELKELLSQRGD